MDCIAKGRADATGAWGARRHHQGHAPGVGARRAGGGPPSRALRPAPRERDRVHRRPRARQRAWRRRDGRAGSSGDRRRGRARASHRDGCSPRRGSRPRHDRRGRLRPSRSARRNILDIAGQGGVYRPSEHLERARTAIDRIGGDPEAFVRSHVRRLEALRRAGHTERIDVDHWRVPADLLDRGQAYDLARDRANIRISILSPTGLDSQIGHDGATWLDRELASPSRTTLANTGFGREVTEAMERRRQSLVNMGHAVRLEDSRIRVSKDFIANLERTEVTRVGKAMAAERALTFTAAKTGEYVSGTLVGSTQLASGRFAMIDDGIGFQLVPWQPVLDKRIGQHITGHHARCWWHRMEFRQETGVGAVSVPNVVTCLSPWGQTGAIR